MSSCFVFQKDFADGLTGHIAGELRLAGEESHGVGLHAGPDRFRRLAQVEGLLVPAGG